MPNAQDTVYETVSSSRLHEQVVRQLRGLILTKRLQPGDPLPSERKLAELCGASRHIVREALRVLERDGLVQVKGGSGAFVTEPDPDSIKGPFTLYLRAREASTSNLHQMREILEPDIAALAARNAKSHHLAAMENCLRQMDEYIRDNLTEKFIIGDEAFHAALAEATGNLALSVIIGPVVDLLRDVRGRSVAVPGAMEEAHRAHQQIYDCVRRRKPAEARRAMENHLREVARRLGISLSLSELDDSR